MEEIKQEVATDLHEEEANVILGTDSYQVDTVFNTTNVIKQVDTIEELEDGWDEFFKPMSF